MIDETAGENQTVVPSRRCGAFEFMADHLYDLVLVIRVEEGNSAKLRRVELYYAERAMISSFVFDRSSKKYASDSGRAISAAMDQLMTEVKSRSLSHHGFTVWYYTQEERDIVERYAREHVEECRHQHKHLKALLANGCLISDAVISVEANQSDDQA